MRLSIVCALVCVVRWSNGQRMEDMPKYDQRYDYLDVDGILDSRRLVKNYVDCLINVKPCTPEGKALRRVLPEALRTKCIRCTTRQKKVAVKVIHRLKTEYPEDWSKLAARWDPTGDFSAYFEHVLAKEHFNDIAGGNELSPDPVVAVPQVPSSAPPPPPPSMLPAPTRDVVLVTPPPPSPPSTTMSVKPLILNRFGDDEPESMGSSTNNNAMQPSSLRPITASEPPRPTAIAWESATASPAPSNPTRFTFRPQRPQDADMTPLYATTVTLIDHFGSKILKTTELVADILRNTVRVFGG